MLAIKKLFNVAVLLATLLCFTSCSTIGNTWKKLIGGGSDTPEATASSPKSQSASFTKNPNVMLGKERKYKRVTKDNFADEQAFEDSAGSLWRREGQGSYLFSQNNLRETGDIINVNMTGRILENLTSKVKLIRQALARLEAPPQLPGKRLPAGAKGAKPDQNQAAAQQAQDNNEQPQQQQQDDKINPEDKFDNVVCRITDKNPDGSYRIKGSQTIFIGRREYKVIVTGVARPDDISQDIIASTKVLDGKFDIMASNKEAYSK